MHGTKGQSVDGEDEGLGFRPLPGDPVSFRRDAHCHQLPDYPSRACLGLCKLMCLHPVFHFSEVVFLYSFLPHHCTVFWRLRLGLGLVSYDSHFESEQTCYLTRS